MIGILQTKYESFRPKPRSDTCLHISEYSDKINQTSVLCRLTEDWVFLSNCCSLDRVLPQWQSVKSDLFSCDYTERVMLQCPHNYVDEDTRFIIMCFSSFHNHEGTRVLVQRSWISSKSDVCIILENPSAHYRLSDYRLWRNDNISTQIDWFRFQRYYPNKISYKTVCLMTEASDLKHFFLMFFYNFIIACCKLMYWAFFVAW